METEDSKVGDSVNMSGIESDKMSGIETDKSMSGVETDKSMSGDCRD